MAVPKKRQTSRKSRTRRNNSYKLDPKFTVMCKNCFLRKLPHHICNGCGFFNGKQVIKVG